MRVLVIGGTRNLGPSIIGALLENQHQVTIFHRGHTLADIPNVVEVLHGDRTDPAQCKSLLGNRDFDAAIDTTLYNGKDAGVIVDTLNGHVGHYIFISTGQVYLVRVGPQRPFREEDYDGPIMPEPPKENRIDHENWIYGIDKRSAEDLFAAAFDSIGFPYTSLRLPMVNSERDHYHRLHGYLLRMWDGGPMLIPDEKGLPLRHIYGEDVVRAILLCLSNKKSIGRAYNISQNETLTLREFLHFTAQAAGSKFNLLEYPRLLLDSARLLPHCSPFSDPWMSSLENIRSKQELGMQYSPLPEYLRRLIEHYREHRSPEPPGYEQRNRELEFAQHHGA
jgi:nucleoside-diphosphate-sugar epimerase